MKNAPKELLFAPEDQCIPCEIVDLGVKKLYHATTEKEKILREGFDLRKTGSNLGGSIYDGVYLTSNPRFALRFAHQLLKVKARLGKTYKIRFKDLRKGIGVPLSKEQLLQDNIRSVYVTDIKKGKHGKVDEVIIFDEDQIIGVNEAKIQ